MMAELRPRSTRIHPPEIEAEYRASVTVRDRRILTLLAGVVVLFNLTSLATDYGLLAGTLNLWGVWSARGLCIFLTLLLLPSLRRSAGRESVDGPVFLWTVVILASVATANVLLPADYVEYVAWDLLLTLGVYTVFPLPFRRQLLLALAFTLASAITLIEFKVLLHPAALPDILLAYLCANGVGAFTSWELHKMRRGHFLALTSERAARVGLEQALSEVKTLRGIIPICAVCKHVRTELGDWRQVEAYVRDHSEADFSHGICPPCLKSYYGELDDPEDGPLT